MPERPDWRPSGAIRRLAPALALVLAVAAVLTGLAMGGDGNTAIAAKVPTATTGAIRTVGPLYRPGDLKKHTCTASVVSSPHHDLLLTAAHCLRGRAAGYVIAPGYHHGRAPYGRWRVTAAYLDPDWLADRDPRRDFAFLKVAPRRTAGHRTDIEDVVGANKLGSQARRGERVTVAGYSAGTDNDSTVCTIQVYLRGEFPAFDCDPFRGGTSGSPWLDYSIRGATVVGLIGGLHQGGCFSSTSYSPPFDARVRRAYLRAIRTADNDAGDRAPDPGSDGC